MDTTCKTVAELAFRGRWRLRFVFAGVPLVSVKTWRTRAEAEDAGKEVMDGVRSLEWKLKR